MRKVIGCLLGICLAVSAQAVTVKWSIPSGTYTSEATFYFVYSTKQVAASDYDSLYTSTKSLSSGGTSGNYTRFDGEFLSPNKVLGGLRAITASTTGYYYLMVFKTDADSYYAVGGGKQYVSGGTNGIYEPTVDGSKPETGAYADMGAFHRRQLVGSHRPRAHPPLPSCLWRSRLCPPPEDPVIRA